MIKQEQWEKDLRRVILEGQCDLSDAVSPYWEWYGLTVELADSLWENQHIGLVRTVTIAWSPSHPLAREIGNLVDALTGMLLDHGAESGAFRARS